MRRVLIQGAMAAAAALALAPALASAEPERDLARQALLAGRLEPFDNAQGDAWEPFQRPFYRSVAPGGRDPVQMKLEPGAYIVVVLCDCTAMDVSLVAPDAKLVPPVRFNDQGAMYSLDVKAAGTYLAGIDMAECADTTCGVAVKAYRRK